MAILTSADDIDNVIATGMYRWTANSIPQNCPISTLGHLIVGGKGTRFQIVMGTSGRFVSRNRYSDGTFTDWAATAIEDNTFENTVFLTNADDLNTLSHTGIYLYNSSSVPDNAPSGGGRVLAYFRYDSTYGLQIGYNAKGSFMVRMKASAGWTSWQDIIYPKDRININVVKGAWDKNGTIQTGGVKGICNDVLLNCVPGSSLSFYLDPHWTYSIREGLSSNNLSVRTAHLSKNARHVITYPYVALNFNRWDSDDEDTVNTAVTDFDQSVIVHTTGSAIDNTTVDSDIHDTPENAGVLNVISRAYQMSKIRYTTVATLPMHSGGSKVVTIEDVGPGTDVEGVVYSSMRETMASVPQATSFQAYMTSLLNPNSYIYTKHYEQNTDTPEHADDPDLEHDYNSRCYYGAVCSTLVAYCYGIENVIPTTISFDNYPGFEPLPASMQNPYSLKLGDSLNRSGDHIVIVTDIIRNYRGRIKSIEVTEAWKPLCRSMVYTPEEIQSKYFNAMRDGVPDPFIAYRYADIASVTYTPSPWVHVDDTETGTPVYSEQLSPRKGDQANWAVGETIEIDVLNAGNHSNYTITNRDTNSVITAAIPANNLISIVAGSGAGQIPAGRYECTLTGGTSTVVPVRFNILSPNVAYSYDSETRKVTVRGVGNTAFSCGGDPTTVPTAVYWCSSVMTNSNYKAVGDFYILTDEDRQNGYVSLTPPDLSDYTENGIWLMRVGFITEFGLYSSALTEVDVSNLS